MTARAAFVGPLPPPINGFAIMCGAMRERMQSSMQLAVFNRAPLAGRPLWTLLSQLSTSLHYFFYNLKMRPKVLYLGLSGGNGQLIDLIYVLIAVCFRRSIFIHHHSFAYINETTALNKCFFACARGSVHIVLSKAMGRALADRYRLPLETVRVISNAAFFPEMLEYSRPDVTVPGRPLHIGFLSNITGEKGIFVFFEILEWLRISQVDFEAHIAGPISPELKPAFLIALARAHRAEYVGAVYGEEKDIFYRKLDVFVFPTKYVNEAEPLVLYEAMSAGACVIACNRGAIAEMLANDGGIAFSIDDMVRGAAEQIKEFSKSPSLLATAKVAARRRVAEIFLAASGDLSRLLHEMSA